MDRPLAIRSIGRQSVVLLEAGRCNIPKIVALCNALQLAILPRLKIRDRFLG